MRIVLPLALLATLTLAGTAHGKTSHAGWPTDLRLWIGPNHNNHHTGTRGDDELLGAHHNDWLNGGPGNDVIWGDQYPKGNDTWQHDTLIGGPGNDIIYASHGYNHIYGGPGNDIIHAHFGRGIIDCGSGHDIVYLSHRSRPHYKLRHCDRISYFTVGH